MGVLHIHVSATNADGTPVSGGKHIVGARVLVEGGIGPVPGIHLEGTTGGNGVANIDLGILFGTFVLRVTATTPKGKVGQHVFTGIWYTPIFDANWEIGVPGAGDEGSAAADLGAWWDGFGDIGKVAIIAGAVIGIGLIAYIISRWFGRRSRNGNGGQNGKR